VGYYGRLDLLEKNRLIHINPKHLGRADSWFERYGTPTVFFSRMLPIIRTFISLPAGVAKMPFWRFSVYTLLGSIPWVLALAVIGEKSATTGKNGATRSASPPANLGRQDRGPSRTSALAAESGASLASRTRPAPGTQPLLVAR
jgi:hypothetical protein